MNILLTCGEGYIGSHTAVQLMQAGHNICVLDNLCTSDEGFLEQVAEIVGEFFKQMSAIFKQLRKL